MAVVLLIAPIGNSCTSDSDGVSDGTLEAELGGSSAYTLSTTSASVPTEPNLQAELGKIGQVTLTTEAELTQFEAMWDYELGEGVDNAQLDGALVIETPCVYLDIELPDEADGEIDGIPYRERVLLRLIRTATRYDLMNDAIWVWDKGPFTTGDKITVGGGEGPLEIDSTSCSFDSVWYTSSMH